MQLTPRSAPGDTAARVRAAACLLLAATPAVAGADDATPGTRIETAALLYGEQARANVVEPIARITRVLDGGQSFYAQFGLDAITGASPTGASPSGRVQTTTTPSGSVSTTTANQVPTAPFHDLRGGLDAGWTLPLGRLLVPSVGVHVSREKDYQSLGVNGRASLDLFGRRTTLTIGGGTNRDRVFPVGGIAVGLGDSAEVTGIASADKQVDDVLAGLSQVLDRRTVVSVSVSRTRESGYLTEPYKVVSVLDAAGYPVGSRRERRPDHRARTSVLGQVVRHFPTDVLHASYREYWDDWGIRSHTVDLRQRHPLDEGRWLEPHVRLYAQRRADFFTNGLADGAALPAYASSDQRLGDLRSATLGATYGFTVPGMRGEFQVRGEYLVQWGAAHPADAIGVQKSLNLAPAESIGSVLVGWSFGW